MKEMIIISLTESLRQYLCSNACCTEILSFGSYVNILDNKSKASSLAIGNRDRKGGEGTYWYST